MTGKPTGIEGTAVPLLWDNVDTDALVPAAPHKRINGGGRDRLREVLFHEFRFDAAGQPRPDFVLNDRQFAGAPILLAGENFGCGSSREVAVWALLDYGFRAVIARSFAEIFEQNAYKNHLLPARVDAATHARIVSALSRPRPLQMSIDLVARRIAAGDQAIGSFVADEMGLEMIVQGVDEFALTAQYVPDILATQKRLSEACPWLAG
ncbi:3-isopropylmalate dehydratase small subunit [Bradyrhizobium sp. KB893862 SZCCT0404]|uniref:3-isopropylmalate dehydratase small subunit n=1 Tax=Bradyrhizobium sp. KB893862 SZCCT0404 TaxID=2807672 RepID=UPI001BAE0956|nr:3-isopropylmalate dehydratase small subunit [Bradyrhizobium sp. KB893862 SZCCT0404]MBR1176197.1 3-isopropylmalate dehydratase small subunit [Bradyrhizobium sp. KB893862 SZCCT0404]